MRWKKSQKKAETSTVVLEPKFNMDRTIRPSPKKMLKMREKKLKFRKNIPAPDGDVLKLKVAARINELKTRIFSFSYTFTSPHKNKKMLCKFTLLSLNPLSFISSSPQRFAPLESSFSVQNYHSITVNFCQRLKLLPMNRTAATQLHRRMNSAFTVKHFPFLFCYIIQHII